MTDAIPSRFVGELPEKHIEEIQGAGFGYTAGFAAQNTWAFDKTDPYDTPGWRRATAFKAQPTPAPRKDVETKGNWLTDTRDHDFTIGQRVFHQNSAMERLQILKGTSCLLLLIKPVIRKC